MSIHLAVLGGLILPTLLLGCVVNSPIERIFDHMLLLGAITMPEERNSVCGCVKAYARAAWKTGAVLVNSARRMTLEQLFGPTRKLGSHLLVVSYYHAGQWHQALVKHNTGISHVLKVEADSLDIVPPRPLTGRAELVEVTAEIKPLLGPAEDCWGQTLTPADLGYQSLLFDVFHGGVRSSVTVNGHEDIASALKA